MKEAFYDNTKSNVYLVSTQNSYADKINKIKYNMDMNKVYANNMKPKNKMNIISEKPTTKVLSSSLNFKPLGFIFIAIIILSALSFFLLFFLKTQEEKKSSVVTVLANIKKDTPSQIINKGSNQLSKILDYDVTIGKDGVNLRYLDENEFNKTDGILYSISKGIIKIDLYFNSSLTNLDHMFEGCKDIIYIDLSHIQPPSINNMSQTFKGCEKLQKINLDSIDTSKVQSMDSLFENCTSLTEIIGIENFDTSSLNNTSRMFYNCKDLILANLSAFNIDNIYNINETFFNNENLKYIDLRNSSSSDSIINILNQINENVTVFVSENMKNNSDLESYEAQLNFSSKSKSINLECNKGKDYKCISCKNNSSLECKECNDGYNNYLENSEYYYLSKMRCWKFEEEKKRK